MTLTIARDRSPRVRAEATPTPARNCANAHWLRTQLAKLHDELLRAEIYEQRPMTSTELRAALTKIQRGEPWA